MSQLPSPPPPPPENSWQRVLWLLEGPDGKSGLIAQFEKVAAKTEEMYIVFRVLKWGVLWLIGPAGTLYLASQLLQFVNNRP